jgi:light-regulated signal transduction histidine kinase (bacteriophytochrome)
VYIKISGFYLGLFSELNDLMVIIISDLRHIKKYKAKIRERESEFNELVYRTHHEIKGPVATIKGLVNLIRHDEESGRIEHLADLINESASVLDQRLKNIYQFYETNHASLIERKVIDLENIEYHLERRIRKVFPDQRIPFSISANDLASLNISGEIIIKLIDYFTASLQFCDITDADPFMDIRISKQASNLKIVFEVKGFRCQKELSDRLRYNRFCMESAIKEEQVLKFYVFRNYVSRLDGIINYYFPEYHMIRCDILIPF